jgi:hypothetical protein
MVKSPSSRMTLPIRLCLARNGLIWIFAAFDLGRHAVYYPRNYPVYEGAYPKVILDWGLFPPGRSPLTYPGGQTAFWANLVPWAAVNAIFSLVFPVARFSGRYVGTTIYGYQNIVWMLVSFVQWYLIGLIIAKYFARDKVHSRAD